MSIHASAMKENEMPAILNTKGAARRLGCSETWIHKLVSAGKLKAYIYSEKGILMRRAPEERRQGQGLYFFVSDLDVYQRGRRAF